MGEVGADLALAGFDDPEPIGVGATATVYRALQPDLGRFVAIKVFDRAGWALDESDPRFLDECVMAGRMSDHPNAMTIYQAGRRGDGVPFIVMELCPNGTLSGRASGSPLDVAVASAVGVRVCGALVTAHARGITHRDVKPSNIVFNVSDEPVLTDFGIGALGLGSSRGTGSYTPGFAPPELARGEHGSAAADVYGWCATFTFVTSGRLPGETGPTSGLSGPTLTPALAALLAAGTEPTAAKRPPMSEVLDAMVEQCRSDGVDLSPVVLPPESATTMVSGPESVTIISEAPTIDPVAPGPRRSRLVASSLVVAVVVVVALVVWAAVRPSGPDTAAATGGTTTSRPSGPTTTLDLRVPSGVVDVSAQLAPKVAAALPSAGAPYPYDVAATEAAYFPPQSDFPKLGPLPARARWSFVNTKVGTGCNQTNPVVTMTGFAGHVRVLSDRTSIEVAAVELLSPIEAHTFFTGRALSLGVDRPQCVMRRGAITDIGHRDLAPTFTVPIDEFNCWKFEGSTKQVDQLEQVAFACEARRGSLEAEVRVGAFVETASSQPEAVQIMGHAVDAILS
jgi:serine/threonine protein kinase